MTSAPADRILANLNKQSILISELFLSLSIVQLPSAPSSSSKQPRAANLIHQDLIKLDSELSQLQEESRKHQIKWKRLEKLQKESEEAERGIRDVLIGLRNGKMELESLLNESKVVLDRIDKAVKTPSDPKTLLTYAATLAPYTSAPPTFYTNQDSGQHIGNYFPPFPTEQTMRRGKLNFKAGDAMDDVEGVGGTIGETTKVQGNAGIVMNGASQIAGNPFGAALTQQPSQPSFEVFDFDLNPDL